MMTVFTDIVLAAANNNLAKLVANELDINNDFSFGTVMLIQPEKEKTFCVPGFYFKPECPCGSLNGWRLHIYPGTRLTLEKKFEVIKK